MKNYDEMANDVLRRIDEQNSLLEEKRENRRKAMPKVIAASVGCVCVVAILGVVAWQTGLINFNKGVYIPRAEIAVEQSVVPNVEKYKYDSNEAPGKSFGFKETGESTDEQPMYIEYEGRIYRQCYDSGPEGSECLGQVNDSISGITGNVEGDVYPVEGMDPEFMLCVDVDDERYNKNDVPGPFYYYINDNDITLRTGKDWFGDRYNVKGNVNKVDYRYVNDDGRTDCFPQILSLPSENVDEFVDDLYNSPFIHIDETMELVFEENQKSVSLTFHLNNGQKVYMNLVYMNFWEEAYLLVDNLSDVCIKIDSPVVEELLNQINGGVNFE